jgi:radical SAM/SPASM domain protein of ACGX system
MKQGFGLQWHITNRCDQKCEHCYIFNSELPVKTADVSLEDARMTVDKYLQFCNDIDRTPVIIITGGDPILHPQFWEIISYLKDNSIVFSVLGNPFHLDAEVIRRLIGFGCRSYQMSLDGLEDTHDTIRKRGSYRETMDKIRLLNENGLSPHVMTTVSRLNCDEIPELTRIIVDAGVVSCAFARYCPTHGDIEQNISPRDYRNFLDKMWSVYSKLADQGTNFSLKDHLWKPYLYENNLIDIKKVDTVCDGCHCGVSHMTLLEDGQVYACRRFESPVGNVYQSDFADIFLGEKMDQYRNIDAIEGCRDCELLHYCRGCNAVSAGSYGSFFARDPQCWRCYNGS